MVDAMMVVKSGAGQPVVDPNDVTWLVVKLPYGEALYPTSHDMIPAGDYVIDIRKKGLDCYPRPEIRKLNWDREGPVERDEDFARTIRDMYRVCSITGTPYCVGIQAAHICPAATNFKIWDVLAEYAFHADVNMTKEFISSGSNGVLLRADLHIAFDAYSITVVQDPTEWWVWRVFALDPAYAGYTGIEFLINRPDDDDDRKRLACTLQLHYMYATQKLAGLWFPV
ncbi:hypothetical protein C2E23DRAFT_866434 [Lenzites betulinus]|nr:hypothetical protein C2E23DRAFT_866434 [Lenzites betulinus]